MNVAIAKQGENKPNQTTTEKKPQTTSQDNSQTTG